jgi:hypothetical protein
MEKARGGMSDISYGGVGDVEGFLGQWGAYVGMLSLLSVSSSTTAGADGIMAAVEDADGDKAWMGWT